jgi:hypothetical protein
MVVDENIGRSKPGVVLRIMDKPFHASIHLPAFLYEWTVKIEAVAQLLY